MKKLLTFVALFISLLYCNAIQAGPSAKPGSYGHVVYNLEYYAGNGARMACMSVADHKDLGPVHLFINSYAGPTKWYIEYNDVKYRKFWIEELKVFSSKWRVLDIDFNHSVGNAVIWPSHNGSNQLWEFVGSGNILAPEEKDGFKGVIINKFTGRMLEALPSTNSLNKRMVAEKLWKGSEEERAYKRDGNFDSISNKSKIWLIWKYYTY